MLELKDDDRITLVHGPPLSGKTSLLFNLAVQEAVKSCEKVSFVCPGVLERLPAQLPVRDQLPGCGLQAAPLTFHYLPTRKQLKRFLIGLHKEKPRLLLIDQLPSYYTDIAEFYQLLKILENSVNFLRRKHNIQCRTVLAASTSDIARLDKQIVADLIHRNISITSAIDPISNDSYYSVDDARKFRMKEDGEGVLRFVMLDDPL